MSNKAFGRPFAKVTIALALWLTSSVVLGLIISRFSR